MGVQDLPVVCRRGTICQYLAIASLPPRGKAEWTRVSGEL